MTCALLDELKGIGMDFYEFFRGPMAWTAFAVCIVATLLRLAILLGRARRINRLHPAKSFSGGFKSIIRGILPLGSSALRQAPLLGIVTFVFHLCVITVPVFLLAHIVLVYESWQLQWVSLPDLPADLMTIIVMAGILFFAVRRWVRKAVRAVSDFSDWALLIVVGGVFLTGLLSYHHWGPYRPLLITHVVLGDILLLMIPFTKLVHMVLFFFTRGYLGAEYEIVMDGEGL
jgi:nitrate reductase gamma subunit